MVELYNSWEKIKISQDKGNSFVFSNDFPTFIWELKKYLDQTTRNTI